MPSETESRQAQRIADLEEALTIVGALAEGFYAVKNIRAWAAEENRTTKQAILGTVKKALDA